jgi:hypothetical protein
MKFIKPEKMAFKDTKLKRLAYGRKVERERRKYPLLDYVGALHFDDVDTAMQNRKFEFDSYETNYRRTRAAKWLAARKLMREHPKSSEIYALWQNMKSSLNPEYLFDLIRNFESYAETQRYYEKKKAERLARENAAKIAVFLNSEILVNSVSYGLKASTNSNVLSVVSS